MINKDHVYGEATKEIYALVPQTNPRRVVSDCYFTLRRSLDPLPKCEPMSEYPAVQYPKVRQVTSVHRRKISRFLDAMLAWSRSILENRTRSEGRFL
jgi:hypothetical protein